MLDAISVAKPNFFILNPFFGCCGALMVETGCAAVPFRSAGFDSRLAELSLL
jgi:hypothetical protein